MATCKSQHSDGENHIIILWMSSISAAEKESSDQNNYADTTIGMLGFTSNRILLQLRREVPTQQDILAPSFKAAVSLTEGEALALAAELLSVVASRRGFSASQDEEPA